MAYLTAFAIGTLARACILLAFSEYVFFNEGPVLHLIAPASPQTAVLGLVEIILFYCLPGALLLVLEPQMTTWPRVIIAGAFVGWSIEAAMVPVAYENIPFSYAWTSISWHAVIDVAIGCVLIRQVLARSRPWQRVCLGIALGVATAIWSTWVWEEVTLSLAAMMIVMGTAILLLIFGYGLAGRVSVLRGPVSCRVVIGVNLLFWLLWATSAPLAALGLALLALANALLLRAARPGATVPVPGAPLPAVRALALVLALPAAGVTYGALRGFDLAPALGDLVVPLVAFGGFAVYLAAVVMALWRRRA